ncbi:acyl carrier protein, partial [Paraburkholderia sp. SIMBA_061]
INKLYQINIPATQIYSHPTLAELVPYVTAEVERNGQQAIDTIKNKIETTTLATEKKQASVIKSDDVQQTSPVSSHEKNANTGSASLHEPSLSSVISTLKKLLAEELFLAEESIEDDAPFLDL